jgi:hypothetical protein
VSCIDGDIDEYLAANVHRIFSANHPSVVCRLVDSRIYTDNLTEISALKYQLVSKATELVEAKKYDLVVIGDDDCMGNSFGNAWKSTTNTIAIAFKSSISGRNAIWLFSSLFKLKFFCF